MQLKSNPEVQSKRIAICEACKHFRKKTRTCGTPVIGNKIGSKRLCGCFMDLKTKLSFSTCPLSKWGDYQITDEDYKSMKRLIADVTHTITAGQKNTMYALLNKYTGTNRLSNNCVPCLKGSLDEIKDIIEEYEK
ncbi:MAG: hypothetical protein Unbinned3205contig1001_41 [Prokaryotic dsDNA virus sp.]|nr:MAG: hypothetical protein Unbinned3205contig1001_41 [Prokaryotic dsDNA virus sp.]|tara:strand:- start:2326 stop:2730 length:405 start_codon:yes stop_codon:yes gene_type:complete